MQIIHCLVGQHVDIIVQFFSISILVAFPDPASINYMVHVTRISTTMYLQRGMII